MQVFTNNQPREVMGWDSLSEKEQADFDWLETDNERLEADFIRYRGAVYCTNEFMRYEGKGWDGYHADSYFSGVLVRYCDDPFYVIVGRYYA